MVSVYIGPECSPNMVECNFWFKVLRAAVLI